MPAFTDLAEWARTLHVLIREGSAPQDLPAAVALDR